MNAGTWVAIAAAVIAAAGAWYGRRQAVAAKRSAKAADDQAKAAKDQVAIMQQQLDNETDDRHEAAGPVFIITESTEGAGPAGKFAAEIMVMQKGGPRLSEVTVTAQPNEGFPGLFGENSEKIVDSIIWKDNAPETTRQLIASLNLRAQRPFNIVLNFRSVEVVTGATWNRTITTNPESPFTVRKFGYRPPSSAVED